MLSDPVADFPIPRQQVSATAAEVLRGLVLGMRLEHNAGEWRFVGEVQDPSRSVVSNRTLDELRSRELVADGADCGHSLLVLTAAGRSYISELIHWETEASLAWFLRRPLPSSISLSS